MDCHLKVICKTAILYNAMPQRENASRPSKIFLAGIHLQRDVADRVTWIHHASRILLTETSTSRRGCIGPIRCPRNRGRLRNYIGEPERVRSLALVPTLISMFWRSRSIARHTKTCSSRCLPQRTTEPMTATMAKSMAYQPPTTMSQNVDMC